MTRLRPFSRGFLPLIVAVIALAATPAHAALTFCNRTENPIDTALGYRNDAGDWVSQGWWKIDPGACAKVRGGALTQRFYFYYATALVREDKAKPPFTWSGKYQFCTADVPFHIEGDGDCESKGYITRQFNEIDLGPTARDYTLDFKER